MMSLHNIHVPCLTLMPLETVNRKRLGVERQLVLRRQAPLCLCTCEPYTNQSFRMIPLTRGTHRYLFVLLHRINPRRPSLRCLNNPLTPLLPVAQTFCCRSMICSHRATFCVVSIAG